MAERLNATVLKTVVRATGPWVRIPLSPPFIFRLIMTSKKIPTVKFLFSLGFISLFTFVIASPNLFPKEEQQIAVNPSFVGYKEEVSSDITMDMITIDESDDSKVGVLQYVVQPGDVLSKIASTFGTTVSRIQKVNKLS